MALTNIDFKQPFKLIINGEEYSCSREFNYTDHVFNSNGSKIELKDVYPNALEQANGNRYTSFKLPKFSFAQLYFGDKIFTIGVVKVQSGGTLNPRKPKHMDITISSYKEWLVSEFMDFPIINMTPESIVHQVVKTMANARIKVGTLAFGNTNRIPVYNAKTKTAYDILRMVEKHSNSIFQVKIEDDETISVNFYNDQSIVNTNNGNKGVDLLLTDEAVTDAFYALYSVEDMEFAENEMKSRNKVRVESEAIISNIAQKQIIDTSQGQSTAQLQFKVGTVDKVGTFVVVDDGTPDGAKRNLTVITQEEASKGKLYDIIYELNSKTIQLNDRLVGKQSTITFTYNSLSRISLDVDNSADQNAVANVAGGGNGRKDQYEKYNDITNVDMLLAMAKRHVEVGTEEKTLLLVDSALPIWNLGEHTNVQLYLAPHLDGEYIVREFKITVKGADVDDGSERVLIEYVLVKSKDLENELNFDDPITYRDNPIFNLAGATVDTTTSIDENIFMVAKDLTVTCSTEGDDLDYDLDFELGHTGAIGNNVPWEY